LLLGYSNRRLWLLLKQRVRKTTTFRLPATILAVSFLWLFSTRPFLRPLLSTARCLLSAPKSERHVIDEQRDCWSPSIAYHTRHTIHDIIALEHQQYSVYTQQWLKSQAQRRLSRPSSHTLTTHNPTRWSACRSQTRWSALRQKSPLLEVEDSTMTRYALDP